MKYDDIVRELKAVIQKEAGKVYDTCSTNFRAMAQDCLNFIEENHKNGQMPAEEPIKGMIGGELGKLTGIHFVRATAERKYGHWLPFDPSDTATLGSAINALWGQIEYTIKKHGQPNNLQWVVKDWNDPLIPDNVIGVSLPDGCSCTIGWTAYFKA